MLLEVDVSLPGPPTDGELRLWDHFRQDVEQLNEREENEDGYREIDQDLAPRRGGA